MELKPFHETTNEELNIIILTKIKGDSGNIYNLEIEIDPLNDGLILKQECNCNGVHYKTTTECKHIKALKAELTKWGVDWRELPTEKSD